MTTQRLHWLGLMSLILSAVIGAGIFDLPRQFAQSTSFFGLFLAWGFTALGIVALAIVFQTLAQTGMHPNDPTWADVQGALKSHYGVNLASLAAWGYWCSAWVGNLAYLKMLSENVLQRLGVSAESNPLMAIAFSSLILWSVFYILTRGLHSFSKLNTLLTGLKFLILFITLTLLAYRFSGTLFLQNFSGASILPESRSLVWQVKNSMVCTAWLFLGFEGAVLIGHHLNDRAAVNRVLWGGLGLVLSIYLLLSVLVYGSLPLQRLAMLPETGSLSALTGAIYHQPKLAEWIGSFILLFAAGALLPWTLYAGTLAQQASIQGLLPHWFKKIQSDGLPYRGILASGGLTQLLLVIIYLYEINYDNLVSAATLSVVPSYFFSAFLVAQSKSGKKKVLAAIAMIYSLWLFCGESLCVYAQLFAIFGLGACLLGLSRLLEHPQQ